MQPVSCLINERPGNAGVMEENRSTYYLELTARYLRKETTVFENNLLLEWTQEKPEHRALFVQAQKVWDMTAKPHQAFAPDANAAWLKVKGKLKGLTSAPGETSATETAPVKVVPLHPFSLLLKVAATVLVFAGLTGITWWFLTTGGDAGLTSIATSETEKMEFYLPDSSKIWLNKNSRFTYHPDFREKRIVFLEGEAFFEVRKSKNKTFTIYTNRAVTQVLGTSFNIRAYKKDGSDRVEVVTGKVSFAPREGSVTDNVYLSPGMLAELGNSDKVRLLSTSGSNALAWKNEKLVFDNSGLEEVVLAIENYFNVEVKIKDEALKKCRFTGSFDRPSIDELMQVLSVSSNITYTKKDNQYLLSGRGCK